MAAREVNVFSGRPIQGQAREIIQKILGKITVNLRTNPLINVVTFTILYSKLIQEIHLSCSVRKSVELSPLNLSK